MILTEIEDECRWDDIKQHDNWRGDNHDYAIEPKTVNPSTRTAIVSVSLKPPATIAIINSPDFFF